MTFENTTDGSRTVTSDVDNDSVTTSTTTTEVGNGTRQAAEYASIQDALDDAAEGREVVIEPIGSSTTVEPYEETISIPGWMTVRGHGIQTYIQGSGDHAVQFSHSDAQLRDIFVDQSDASGSYDGVLVNHKETVIGPHVDVDAAPRYGVNITGDRCHIVQIQLLGGDNAAIHIGSGATRNQIENAFVNAPGDGIVDEGDFSRIDAVIDGVGGKGLNLQGTHSRADVVVRGAGGRGVDISGNDNKVDAVVDGSTDEALVVGGDRNVVDINTSGDVFLSGDNNTITGRAGGSVNDSTGTNDTSNLN